MSFFTNTIKLYRDLESTLELSILIFIARTLAIKNAILGVTSLLGMSYATDYMTHEPDHETAKIIRAAALAFEANSLMSHNDDYE
jgi:hypothetical protein